MLYDLDGKSMTRIPFQDKYHLLITRLTDNELQNARQAINDMIEGTEINTAGWMPGKNWEGTDFDPIYRKAARKDEKLAAQLFGLLVWEVFMNRPEDWFTGRFEKDGQPIGSRTYFRRGK